MKSRLQGLWLVGKPRWKGDLATATLAKSKTIARQCAEGELANARLWWDKHCEAIRRRYQEHSQQDYATFDEYAKAMAAGDYPDSYDCKVYLLLLNGIWIYSPAGEAIYIKEASRPLLERMRRKQAAYHKKTDAMINGLISTISQ